MSDSNRLTRRSFLKATGGAAGAAAIAGCTGDQDGSGGSTETGGQTGTSAESTDTSSGGNSGNELDGTVFTRTLTGTITTIDPVAATDTASGTVIQQVFDCLMGYKNATPVVENELAADYQVSDDYRTYTFSIKDATYHNGDKVKAQDFVYAWERLASSSNSRRAYFILDSIGVKHQTTTKDGDDVYKSGSLDVTAEDDKTLVVNLKEPFHDTLEMMAYTSFAALPEGIVGDIDGYDGKMDYKSFANNNPVGAGPFKFNFWQQGTAAAVDKFEDYHGQVANVDHVKWQVLEDDTALYNFSMNKNADWFEIPTPKYDPNKVNVENTDEQGRKLGTYGPLRNGDTAQYVGVPTLSTFYVGFNMKKVPKPVRQAFAYVMDQGKMVEEVFKDRGNAAYTTTPPTIFPGGAKEAQSFIDENYPYGKEAQIQKAKQVMEEAGYGPNNKFELQWTQYDSNTWEEMAKILRDQLEPAHIKMNIQKAKFSTLLQRGRQGQLQVYTLGWIADWPAADNFLQLLNPPQTNTDQKGPISYINWTPENGDAAQKATDAYETVKNNPAPTDQAQQARNEAYLAIEQANWEDVGFLNVYHELTEAFWYDHVDITPFGGMGDSRQKYNGVSVDK